MSQGKAIRTIIEPAEANNRQGGENVELPARAVIQVAAVRTRGLVEGEDRSGDGCLAGAEEEEAHQAGDTERPPSMCMVQGRHRSWQILGTPSPGKWPVDPKGGSTPMLKIALRKLGRDSVDPRGFRLLRFHTSSGDPKPLR